MSIENRPGVPTPSDQAIDRRLQPSFVTEVIGAVRGGIKANLESRPTIPESWNDKIAGAITERWPALSDPAKRVVWVAASLGQTLPDCGTLPKMAQLAVKQTTFQPERLIELFQRLQQRSRKLGYPVLAQRNMLLAGLIPTLALLPDGERDMWLTAAVALPPVIVASLSDNNNDGFIREDGDWSKEPEDWNNDSFGPDESEGDEYGIGGSGGISLN